MSLPSQGIRQRRNRTLNEIVQDFDAFNKVEEKVKDQKTVRNGIYSICCFLLIIVLCCGEIHHYWFDDNVLYKFSVDTDYDERPTLNFDMIIAAPCNSISPITTSPSDSIKKQAAEQIVKEPSRFEMDENENNLWQKLKEAQRQQFKPGTRLKSLNDLSFVGKNVEQNLQTIAKSKVADEAVEIEKQRELNRLNGNEQENDGAQVVMMIGQGGVFQIISSNKQGPNEGTACRIRGQIPVLKGDGDRLVIASTNMLNLPGLFGGLQFGEGGTNFSHRIERFNFGHNVRGLISPLSGTEKISEKGSTMYKYYIKVVPTLIHHSFGSTLTYQYSVTGMQRDGDSGLAGITFSYEFNANVIEVFPNGLSFIQLLLRLCAVIGGVFATSSVLHTIVHSISSAFKPKSPAYQKT
ncbi:Protein of unknown function DUF1692 domain containing protein [Aphelenchoides bicaudatus]|nr:Protein of unknown function DUF1692 domain containing protein [Aphelenchoides bicaudatus]